MRPFRMGDFSEQEDLNFIDSAKFYYLVGTKFLRDHLIEVDKGDLYLTVDPLLDFSYAMDLADTTAYPDTVNLFRNTRGFLIQGKIGEQVSFRTSFLENQVYLPAYLRDFANFTGVVPGQGRHKEFNTVGFDFAYSSGFVNWRARPWLDVSIGNGKSFVGHGYRSLLLSDASFNRPYIRLQSHLMNKKLQFTYEYSELQSLDRLPRGEVPESLFKQKGMSWQYLSYCPVPQLELGLFSSVIWQRLDSNEVLNFNYLALNPIPFSNAAILGWDDANNFVGGLNLRYKLSRTFHIYAQLALDDLNQKRIGYQSGLRAYDILPGVDASLEYNTVSRGTFGSSTPLQAYTHFNQSLAHPSGTHFQEIWSEIRWQYRRFFLQLRYNYIERQIGYNSNVLTTLFNDDDLTNIDPAPDSQAYTNMLDARLIYLLNPKTNLRLEFGLIERLDRAENFRLENRIISFGLKTSIFNEYYDF